MSIAIRFGAPHANAVHGEEGGSHTTLELIHSVVATKALFRDLSGGLSIDFTERADTIHLRRELGERGRLINPFVPQIIIDLVALVVLEVSVGGSLLGRVDARHADRVHGEEGSCHTAVDLVHEVVGVVAEALLRHTAGVRCS